MVSRSLLFGCISALCCCWLALPVFAAEKVTVVVEGIEGKPHENVVQALAIPPGIIQEGKVDRLWLERFAKQAQKKVLVALEPFGYYHTKTNISIATPANDVYEVRVLVRPGDPVRVALVELLLRGPGEREAAFKELITRFPVRQGDVLLQQDYEKGKESLISKAQELGYLDAAFSLHEIRIDPFATAARIRLHFETGNQYRFGAITIEGAPDYPETFLRRHVSFKQGDVFSYAKLGETQLNFSNSERFKDVVITPEKEKASNFVVPVLVQLKPVPRRSLKPGIGYGTDTGARVGVNFRDLNVFHRGEEFNAQVFIAERLQGFAAGYIFPNPKDIRSFRSLQLNLQQENITTYISRLASFEVNENRSFGHDKLGTLYLKFLQENFTIGAQQSSSRIVMPGLRFIQDHYQNAVRPVQGFRYALELRGTHQYLGADTAFLQTLADGSFLVPLPWRLSFRTRVMTGFTVVSDPLSDLSPSVRFFAGGDRSVRGYSYKSLGPRDATGQVTGGKHLLAANFDLERALFQDWGVSIFYDAGNAFNSFNDLTFAQGAGIGLHYYTRVGSINLYFGRQLAIPDPGYRIHVTVGFEL